MDFFSALSEEKSFLAVSVGVLMFTFVRVLSFVVFCFVIGALGPGVFFLHLLVLVRFLLGLLRIMMLLSLGWRGCSVLTLTTLVENGLVPSDHFLDSIASSDVSDRPDVWTDGSFVHDELSGVGVRGCGVYSLKSGVGWFDRRWGHLESLPPGEFGVERCVLFDSVRGPLQSVQRAELWGVILALQCSSAVHLGVDNLNVVRHVSRILEGRVACRPFELTSDGDLLTVITKGCSVCSDLLG